MASRLAGLFVLVSLMSGMAFGQSSTPTTTESHKFRTIMTIAGAGGGFAAGVFVGLSAFDDAVNSDRKVWTTAIVGAAAGGVGGFFIGRAIDHRKRKTAGLAIPVGAAELQISPKVSRNIRGIQFAMKF
jgi:hypothetical protein